jgi:hypothetical protein
LALAFNIDDPGGEWQVNTAEHWTLTNSTITYDRHGMSSGQETHQRDSGHVLWQNVTMKAKPGTGGWTSIGASEHLFNVTYDNVTLPSMYPDPSAGQSDAFEFGGIYMTLKNSTITMNGNFNAPNSLCAIISDANWQRGFDGYYTFQNNTINGTANGAAMIAVGSSFSTDPHNYIISGNKFNIGPGGDGTYGVVVNWLNGGFTIDGNTNVGPTAGAGIVANGSGNCAVTNNTRFGTYFTGACTQSNNH